MTDAEQAGYYRHRETHARALAAVAASPAIAALHAEMADTYARLVIVNEGGVRQLIPTFSRVRR